jgi:hypothetical protein
MMAKPMPITMTVNFQRFWRVIIGKTMCFHARYNIIYGRMHINNVDESLKANVRELWDVYFRKHPPPCFLSETTLLDFKQRQRQILSLWVEPLTCLA